MLPRLRRVWVRGRLGFSILFIAMPVLEILKYPDPRLQQPCRPVEQFDEHLRTLAEQMIETMQSAAGIGLAAPQVGEHLQLTVIDLSGSSEPDKLLVLVNPVVEHQEGEVRDDEGCLSFPDLILVVPRPSRVVVTARDLDGEPFRVDADGLMARCLHHEIDHLKGVLFIDRVSPLKQDMARRKIAKRIRAGDW
ncbi:MAG: peptide deformylase [Acidobacteriota bacterium]